MLLEAMARLIIQMEEMSPDEFGKFEVALKRNRLEHWYDLPWPDAARDEGRFQEHVARLAAEFTTDDAAPKYPLRRTEAVAA